MNNKNKDTLRQFLVQIYRFQHKRECLTRRTPLDTFHKVKRANPFKEQKMFTLGLLQEGLFKGTHSSDENELIQPQHCLCIQMLNIQIHLKSDFAQNISLNKLQRKEISVSRVG